MSSLMEEMVPCKSAEADNFIKSAPAKAAAAANEYGRILVFKKDGTEAAIFGLTGEINIGRDRNCDIRIKIPSVSRNHARIYQDENGNCTIENLSTANVTTVNGELVPHSVILKHGDVFCVGLREFVYQNGDKNTDNTDYNANLVVRQGPVVDDENLTLDFAKNLSNKALRAKPLTPIQEMINEGLTPVKPVAAIAASVVAPVVSIAVMDQNALKSTKMDPSMLRAICKRRKSYNASIDIKELIAENAKPVKSPGNTLKEMNATTVRQMNATIKDAINARRKSYGIPAPSKSPKAVRNKTPTKKAQDEEVKCTPVDFNLSLLQAISARRTSYTPVVAAAVIVAPVVVMEEVKEVKSAKKNTPKNTPKKCSTPSKSAPENEVVKEMTPLRSTTPTPVASKTPVSAKRAEEAEEVIVSNSPIRQAINARRRSSLSFEESVHASDLIPESVQVPFDGITIVIPQIAERYHSNLFVSSSIGRRVSMGVSAPATQAAIMAAKKNSRKSVAGVVYRSSRLSLSKDTLVSEVDTMVAEHSVDEDIVLICMTSDRQSILTIPSAIPATEEECVEVNYTPVKSDADRSIAIKQAICVQLAVDAFANELEMQGVPPGRAYATAVDTYLSNPSAFSPKRVTVKATRRRDSILASLEKKAKSTGDSLFGMNKGDEQLSCDLIAALTDSDMDIIDSYALRLEEAGGEAEESYAIALDAFVRGVEHCHMKTKVEIAPAPIVCETIIEAPSVAEVAVEEMVVSEVEAGCELPPFIDANKDEETLNFGASLRSLFDLPFDYEGRDEADDDEKLVARYAEDLRDETCIDAAVAYGIALDTFLADPVAFRHQIGGVKKRLDEMYEREPFQTPEYEYDFYCNDEEHSIAKSTTMKVVPQSNSHTYFSSPTPVSSACKMASLYEDAEEEDEIEADITSEILPSSSETEQSSEPSEPSNSHIFFTSTVTTPVTTPVKSSVKSSAKESSPWENPMDVEVAQLSPVPMVKLSAMVLEAEVEAAIEEEVVEVAVCPTTPSKGAFKAAFSVIKSAKKSPYISSAKKTPTKTPSKIPTRTPIASRAATPTRTATPAATTATPIVATETIVDVEVEAIIETIEIEIESVTDSTEEVIESVMSFDLAVEMEVEVEVPSEEVLEVVSETLPEEAPLAIEEVAIEVEEISVGWVEVAAPAALTPVKAPIPAKVEAWLASAAASLKKSLPPKSPFKSAKKQKIPTPRQSRMCVSTSSVEEILSVNLFSEVVEADIVVAVVSEVASVDVAEMEVMEAIVGVAEIIIEEISVIAEVPIIATVDIIETIHVVEMPEESVNVIEETVETVESKVTTPVRSTRSQASASTAKSVVKSVVKRSSTRGKATEAVVEVPAEVLVIAEEVVEAAIEEVPTPTEETATDVAEIAVEVEVAAPVEEIVEVEIAPTQEIIEITPIIEEVEVAPVEEVVVSATPARVTRSRVATPAKKTVEKKSKKSTPASKAVEVAEVVSEIAVVAVEETAVAITEMAVEEVVVEEVVSAVAPVEAVVEVSAIVVAEVVVAVPSIEVEAPAPATATRGRPRKSSAPVEVASVKRSRRGEKIDTAFQADEAVPDMIVFPSEEVPDMIVFAEETPIEVAEVATAPGVAVEVVAVVPVAVPTPKKASVRSVRSAVKKVSPIESEVTVDIEMVAVVEVAPKGRGRRSAVHVDEIEAKVGVKAVVSEVLMEVVVSEVDVKEVKKEVKGRGRPSRAVKAVEEEEALILICDGCDAEHFLDTTGLKKIPEGDRFCEPCVAKESAKEAVKESAKESVDTSSRQSSRSSTAQAVKSTPAKAVKAVEVAVPVSAVVSRKRGVEEPTPVPEGRRSARLH